MRLMHPFVQLGKTQMKLKPVITGLGFQKTSALQQRGFFFGTVFFSQIGVSFLGGDPKNSFPLNEATLANCYSKLCDALQPTFRF